jgi:hypothetical protein
MWKMRSTNISTWYDGNAYSRDSACEHCSGVIRHKSWCITQNHLVSYAYGAVLDADRLSLGDRIILHALGVVWSGKVCDGSCQTLGTATSA